MSPPSGIRCSKERLVGMQIQKREQKQERLVQKQKAQLEVKYHLPRTEHMITDKKAAETVSKKEFATKDIDHSIENLVN